MAAHDLGPGAEPIRLIFSHANGFNARTYHRILEPLAHRARILAVDMRGHGQTRLPTGTEGRRTWDDFKGDLTALVIAEDLHDVVLAGHSMGATVSLMAAPELNGRVRSLLLLEPVVKPVEGSPSPRADGALRRRAAFSSRAEALDLYRRRAAFGRWDPGMLEDYVEDAFLDESDGGVRLATAPAWEYANYVHQEHDPRAALAGCRVPIHILKADTDSTCSLDAAEARALTSAPLRLEVIPDTTHFLPMERPDVAAAALAAAVGD